MKFGRYVAICLLVVLALFSDLTGSAYAAHARNMSRQHYRIKKSSGLFGRKYHAPKRPRDSKGKFRSPVSGNILYGKPVKHK